MAKVKKGAGLTGERNTVLRGKTKAGKRATTESRGTSTRGRKLAERAARGATKSTSSGRSAAPMKKSASTSRTVVSGAKRKAVAPLVKGTKGKAARKQQKRGSALALVRGKGKKPAIDAPVVIVAVKELDPLRKCGRNTTVQFLYRVDESVDGRKTAHLVFFDRHGWYCEHGRTCPAVGHAKKHNGQIARVS